ncbi:MAG: hypothetical protein NT141_01625 [candidate division WWE3 bacterium]|nr:hypothetical protein [candidate division WWE3 bacterium]
MKILKNISRIVSVLAVYLTVIQSANAGAVNVGQQYDITPAANGQSVFWEVHTVPEGSFVTFSFVNVPINATSEFSLALNIWNAPSAKAVLTKDNVVLPFTMTLQTNGTEIWW